MTGRRQRAAACAAAVCLATAGGAQQVPLAVADGSGWRGLWRPSATAPAQWNAPDSALLSALTWKSGQRGIAYTELPLRGDGEAWRTRAIVVRIDPARARFRLDTAFRHERDENGAVMRMARWRIEDATSRALLAVNAGQFRTTLLGTMPWGWVVLQGREWHAPGVGPLSMAVAFDSGGAVTLRPPSDLARADRAQGVQFAFQSFPTLLDGDGNVPAALRTDGSGVDLTHRDARLAIGVQRDGMVLLVMTRFDVFGRTLGAVPFGLTTPEMAALMGALGAQRAVMLDGGISAQLQLRDATGGMQRWPGWRRVPLGLLVMPR
ncbi:MAG: phosphodiester glycosidase family protein [Gemmatimonadaceae bacterium]|nr:phosphodiester glycosidase family protein [Gemmatimonadaceae bacterium]